MIEQVNQSALGLETINFLVLVDPKRLKCSLHFWIILKVHFRAYIFNQV
jgi:hypothetical protein